MSERNVTKARTCTECGVNHSMVTNAYGLKKHARDVRRKRLSEVEKQNAEESKVESPEKILRDSPEESPAGNPTAWGSLHQRNSDFRSARSRKDEGERTLEPQEVT